MVAGAVLQSSPSLIHSLTDWAILYFKYLPNTANPKPEELRSWSFERMFIQHHVSCVMGHVSRVMCHVSPVTYHVSPVTYQNQVTFFLYSKKIKLGYFFILQKIWQSGGAGRCRVCYQRGLPRLVLFLLPSSPSSAPHWGWWKIPEEEIYTSWKVSVRKNIQWEVQGNYYLI